MFDACALLSMRGVAAAVSLQVTKMCNVVVYMSKEKQAGGKPNTRNGQVKRNGQQGWRNGQRMWAQ